MTYNIENQPVLVCDSNVFHINDIVTVEGKEETVEGRLIDIVSQHDSSVNNDSIKLDCSEKMMCIQKSYEMKDIKSIKMSENV